MACEPAARRRACLKASCYASRHALVAGNLAYGAWRVGGLTNWGPPFGGGTHSPLPLPDDADYCTCTPAAPLRPEHGRHID